MSHSLRSLAARIWGDTVLRLKKPTKDNLIGGPLFGGVAVIVGVWEYGWSWHAIWDNFVGVVILPWILVGCMLFAWHLIQAARAIAKEERVPFENAGGGVSSRLPWHFRWRRYCVVLAYLCIPIACIYFTVEKMHIEKPKPWCYALVIDKWPLMLNNPKVYMVIDDPTGVAAHNVKVDVMEPNPRPLGGPGNLARPVEMYNMMEKIVPLVDPDPDNQIRWIRTGQEFMDIPLSREFDIVLKPEHGDAVEEVLQFTTRTECIHSVTRIRDKKILLQEVAPPFDGFGMRNGKQGWQKCQAMIL